MLQGLHILVHVWLFAQYAFERSAADPLSRLAPQRFSLPGSHRQTTRHIYAWWVVGGGRLCTIYIFRLFRGSPWESSPQKLLAIQRASPMNREAKVGGLMIFQELTGPREARLIRQPNLSKCGARQAWIDGTREKI